MFAERSLLNWKIEGCQRHLSSALMAGVVLAAAEQMCFPQLICLLRHFVLLTSNFNWTEISAASLAVPTTTTPPPPPTLQLSVKPFYENWKISRASGHPNRAMPTQLSFHRKSLLEFWLMYNQSIIANKTFYANGTGIVCSAVGPFMYPTHSNHLTNNLTSKGRAHYPLIFLRKHDLCTGSYV